MAFLIGLKVGKSKDQEFVLCDECGAATVPVIEALNAMPGTELADALVRV